LAVTGPLTGVPRIDAVPPGEPTPPVSARSARETFSVAQGPPDVTAAETTDGDLAELRERVAAVVTTSTAGYADVELDPTAWTAADMDRLLEYAHTRRKITAAEAGLLRYLLRQTSGSSAAPVPGDPPK